MVPQCSHLISLITGSQSVLPWSTSSFTWNLLEMQHHRPQPIPPGQKLWGGANQSVLSSPPCATKAPSSFLNHCLRFLIRSSFWLCSLWKGSDLVNLSHWKLCNFFSPILIFLIFYFQTFSNSLKPLGMVVTTFWKVVPPILILTPGSCFRDCDLIGFNVLP